MNSFQKGAMYSLLFFLLIPLSGIGQSKLRVGAIGYLEHHNLNTVEYQLPGRGLQFELGWNRISLVASVCNGNSRFYDLVRTDVLRIYECKGASLRLQYYFRPEKKIQPFVFAGLKDENLTITYADMRRRHETVRENLFGLYGLGMDVRVLPFLKLRVEAGRSGDWFARVGLGVCLPG